MPCPNLPLARDADASRPHWTKPFERVTLAPNLTAPRTPAPPVAVCATASGLAHVATVSASARGAG